ncbi:MAG TPA: substrate-binding domain-containing protein [Xanthobacteraceae bacterium]|nr:substrate-binding domain-containing protein [Xanthobacteraceae bacterium]
MKITTFASAIALAAAGVAVAGTAHAQSRNTIQIAGSSTVLPFSSIAAEEFGQAFPKFSTPVVGSGGTGGGFRQFCQGVGTGTIDIANASRPITAKEIESCHQNNVKQILEVQFGFDGIVFASRADKAEFKLEPKFVFAAMAAQVEQNGKLVPNPYTRWSQIDKSLPDQEISLVIPASNHGTREVFEEKVVTPGCRDSKLIAAMKGDEQKNACLGLRQDGRVVEIAGDYTETLARLQAQADAVGVFGLSFYDQNRDKLRVATVSGVTPSLETVAKGEYPVSRPLFFYVKGEHIGVVPGLQEFAQFFLSDTMAGSDGKLVDAGLIPMDAAARNKVLESLKARKAVGN